MSAAVYLCNPKRAYNAGAALRACAVFGAVELSWYGDRVLREGLVARSSTLSSKKYRLPREERMSAYGGVKWGQDDRALDRLTEDGFTPVCIEIADGSESLATFEHPYDAVYVFGPEDGHVPKGVRTVCHRFVTIPALGCLNLGAAVNVVLAHRYMQEGHTEFHRANDNLRTVSIP